MNKKLKKVFKKKLNIAPKVTLTNRWTSWRINETKSRIFNEKNTLKKLALQTIWSDKKLINNKEESLLDVNLCTQFLLGDLNKKASVTLIKNYCSFTGRSRGVNNKLFMARHTLRKFIRFGMLPGFIQERC